MSENIKDSEWVYKKLRTPSLQWGWTARLDTLVNKSTRIFDITTLVLLVLALFYSIEVALMVYTSAWLGFFAFYVSPILFLERSVRLIYSWWKAGGLDKLKETSKDKTLQSKSKFTQYKKEGKSWIKSGFK